VHCVGIAVVAGFANSLGFGGFAADLAGLGLAVYANSTGFGGFAVGFAAHLTGSVAGFAAYFAT
jgi:hypothetical protein